MRASVTRPNGMNSELVSVILPTYDERGTIVTLLDRVERILQGRAFEIIVIDDNSPDGTWDVVQTYAQRHPRVRLERRLHERGLSSAVVRGFELSRGSIFAVMDADLSHDEGILPSLVEAIEEGAELSVGTRRAPGGGAVNWPWHRRIFSDAATFVARVLLDVELSDPMSGYFCLRRPLYEWCRQRLNPRGYKILLEMYCRARPVRVHETPFIFRNRREGYSKLTAQVALMYFAEVASLFLERLRQATRRAVPPGADRRIPS